MGIIDQPLLSHVREQADRWLGGPNSKPETGDDSEPSQPEESQTAPESADERPPSGGDLAADEAASAGCVATSEESHLGSGLVAMQAPAVEAPTDVLEEVACDTEEPADPPSGFSAEETLLIFDWDDTILPSSWVAAEKMRLDASCGDLTEEQREQLAKISDVATATLNFAKEHGQVIIITNAERGWVELTSHRFLPKLAPLLESVRIVSARTAYESEVGPDPQDWKIRAFEDEIRLAYGSFASDPYRRKNVISLGDSAHERRAVMQATAELPNCICKSLKFATKPDIAQMCRQHVLIAEAFPQILGHDGNLDLCLRID